MKKIVLKVVKQRAAMEGVTPQYIKQDILPEFFKSFWVRRMALDRRNYKQVVETTVEPITKVIASLGAADLTSVLKIAWSTALSIRSRSKRQRTR